MRRAKVLGLLRQIRGTGSGPNTQDAIIKVTSQQIQNKTKGKPFLTKAKSQAQTLTERLFLPSRINHFYLLMRKSYRKAFNRKKLALSQKLFGNEGNFGMIVLRPELFGQFSKVREVLKSNSFQVVLSKTFLFDKTSVLEIYSKATQDFKKYLV